MNTFAISLENSNMPFVSETEKGRRFTLACKFIDEDIVGLFFNKEDLRFSSKTLYYVPSEYQHKKVSDLPNDVLTLMAYQGHRRRGAGEDALSSSQEQANIINEGGQGGQLGQMQYQQVYNDFPNIPSQTFVINDVPQPLQNMDIQNAIGAFDVTFEQPHFNAYQMEEHSIDPPVSDPIRMRITPPKDVDEYVARVNSSLQRAVNKIVNFTTTYKSAITQNTDEKIQALENELRGARKRIADLEAETGALRDIERIFKRMRGGD